MTSTLHLVPQPITFNLSEIPDTEPSPKDTTNEAEGIQTMGTRSRLIPNPQRKRDKQDTSVALQLEAEVFSKITRLNISKIKVWILS